MTDSEKIDMLTREVADLKQMVMGISQMCNVLISMGNGTYANPAVSSQLMPYGAQYYLRNAMGQI